MPRDISTQISKLKDIKDGWLDGIGEHLSPEGLNWVQETLTWVLANYSLPDPYLYPTLDGDVQAEWSTKTHEVSILFDLSIKKVWLSVVCITSSSDQYLEVPDLKSQLGELLTKACI